MSIIGIDAHIVVGVVVASVEATAIFVLVLATDLVATLPLLFVVVLVAYLL